MHSYSHVPKRAIYSLKWEHLANHACFQNGAKLLLHIIVNLLWHQVICHPPLHVNYAHQNHCSSISSLSTLTQVIFLLCEVWTESS